MLTLKKKPDPAFQNDIKPVVGSKVFLVTGRIPLAKEIRFLRFPDALTTRRRVGVDVGSSVSLNTGHLLVIAEPVPEALGFADVNRCPVIWGSLLSEDIEKKKGTFVRNVPRDFDILF